MQRKMGMDKKQYALLMELMKVHFVVVELQLFLDTHPDDTEALRLYNNAAARYHRLINEYQRKYAMLMSHSVDYTGNDKWNWLDSPWPWELEFS